MKVEAEVLVQGEKWFLQKRLLQAGSRRWHFHVIGLYSSEPSASPFAGVTQQTSI